MCADCSSSSWHVHKCTRPGITFINLSRCYFAWCCAALEFGVGGGSCVAPIAQWLVTKQLQSGSNSWHCIVLSFAPCKAPLAVSTCVLCTYCTYGWPKAYSTLLCQDYPLDFAVICCNVVGKSLHIFLLTCGRCGCHALTEKIWTKNVAYANFLTFSQHSCNSENLQSVMLVKMSVLMVK